MDPPFLFFGTVTLFKNLKFFFEKVLMPLKGPPSIFSHILQETGVSKSSKGPPLQF